MSERVNTIPELARAAHLTLGRTRWLLQKFEIAPDVLVGRDAPVSGFSDDVIPALRDLDERDVGEHRAAETIRCFLSPVEEARLDASSDEEHLRLLSLAVGRRRIYIMRMKRTEGLDADGAAARARELWANFVKLGDDAAGDRETFCHDLDAR